MKTPKEVILSVEDNIDHPAHVISERLADMALAALDAAGFVIVTKDEIRRLRIHGPDETASRSR